MIASAEERYISGRYLEHNVDWHASESPWKTEQIVMMLKRNRLAPHTVCDVGCGAGEVLARLQARLVPGTHLLGYEISPVAFAMCEQRANANLEFKLGDIRREPETRFDLLLLLDVMEHVEDYLGFLRDLHRRGKYTLLHIPLDVSVQTVLRSDALLLRRDYYGHLHYFTKETALRTLEETGYQVVDVVYTPYPMIIAGALHQRLLTGPRKLLFRLRPDWAARLLGGFSLLVLAT